MLTIIADSGNLTLSGCIEKTIPFSECDGIIETSCGDVIHYWWDKRTKWNAEVEIEGPNGVDLEFIKDKNGFTPKITINSDVQWVSLFNETDEHTEYFQGKNYQPTKQELNLISFLENCEDFENYQIGNIAFMARMIFK